MSDRRRRALSKSSDYLDALATTLRDLGGPATIPHELTQNADDAEDATIIRFTVSPEALTVWNDGTFTDCLETRTTSALGRNRATSMLSAVSRVARRRLT